jgi:hypothetical protein
LADEQKKRHFVLLGGVDRDRRIARARPAAHAGDPRPAGEPRVGKRHESGARLVPAHHGVDIGAAIKRVEQPEIALARDAEDAVDGVRHEAIDDQLTGRAH